MRVVLLAGETSGDLLGAALAAGLRARCPGVECTGITGPKMRAEGCASMADISELSVMGLVEVLRVLPRILRLRRRLYREILAMRPDVVIGIDAPDFNLPLEKKLKRAGLRVVHMVSPTIWAWRPRRRFGIARACDAVLCLYPFEPDWYADTAVRAEYIGHPLADELDDRCTPGEARARLDLAPGADRPLIAVLPGSRASEVARILPRFAAAVERLAADHPGLCALLPVADPALRERIGGIVGSAPGVDWKLLDGHSRDAMRAADVLLVASGTATMEALLLGRPMVVSYVAAPSSVWIMRRLRLLKTPWVAMPNILTGGDTVPEFLQDAATPDALAGALGELLDRPEARDAQLRSFDRVREALRCGAGARAAEVIIDLAGAGA